MPAKYVKAFLKGNKNDFRDAEAIAEADAGLHAAEAGWHVGEPGFELPARQLLAQHDGAPLVEANEMEDVLADVDAEHGNGAFGLARHGGLLKFRTAAGCCHIVD